MSVVVVVVVARHCCLLQSAMDDGVQLLQQRLVEVEAVAEKLLLARHEMVECDRARNGNREALTALRKQAKTSRSSVLLADERREDGVTEEQQRCRTCGDHDGTSPLWVMCPGADLFIRRPFHQVHCDLDKEQERLEVRVKGLQSDVKERTMQLSDKGALADRIGPNLLNALVTLRDNSS